VLTVRETLVLAARLAGVELASADALIEELGLGICKNTNVYIYASLLKLYLRRRKKKREDAIYF
jgi:ABC-type multidrug transport system ATPase subunit